MALASEQSRAAAWDPVLQYCCRALESPGTHALSLRTLLQISKATQRAVAVQCKGKLPIRAHLNSLQAARAFADWLGNPVLASVGHIIHTLSLGIWIQDTEDKQQAESVLAAALVSTAAWAAGVSPSSRMMVEFSSSTASTVIWQGLAAANLALTSLELDFWGSAQHWTRDNVTQLGKEIGQLATLVHLRLGGCRALGEAVGVLGGGFVGLDCVVKHLSSLTNLTSLETGEAQGRYQKHLPVGLKQLTYTCFDLSGADPGSFQLDLGHLTALTKLTLYNGTEWNEDFGRFYRDGLIEGALPANLLDVQITNCSSSSSMMQCQQLTRLVCQNCRMSGEGLEMLTNLSALSVMDLSISEDWQDRETQEWEYYASDTCKVWGELPIKRLGLGLALCEIYWSNASIEGGSGCDTHGSSRSKAVLQQVALQAGLTSLSLDVKLARPGVYEQLGLLVAPLRQLRGLHHLSIRAEYIRCHNSLGGRVALRDEEITGPLLSTYDKGICKTLAQVLGALPHLQSICIDCMPTRFGDLLCVELAATSNTARLDVKPMRKFGDPLYDMDVKQRC